MESQQASTPQPCEKGESSARLGVDILGKRQMEDTGCAASARAVAESSGRTSRPFQARRDQTTGTVDTASMASAHRTSRDGLDTTQEYPDHLLRAEISKDAEDAAWT